MSARTFVDTNVLVYALDVDEPEKRQAAIDVLSAEGRELVVSAQVLAEFYVTVTRKLRRPLDPDEAAARVAELSQLPVMSLDSSLVATAIAISRQAGISYWDAAIAGAAAAAGCGQLLSEDLEAGAVIAGVRVDNPFLIPPEDPADSG